MAPLTYKPRPKMHSWTPPLPPKPRRSRFYFWAVLGWLGATAVSYRWLSSDASDPDTALAEADVPAPSLTSSTPAEPQRTAVPATTGAAPDAPARSEDAPTMKPFNGEIRACEEFLQQAKEMSDVRLPAYLGRSAIDTFIGENDWARPCRTNHRRIVDLCVAIRDGAVQGLTARTSPPNLTLENCLREQARKLSLQPEASVRVIRTKIAL